MRLGKLVQSELRNVSAAFSFLTVLPFPSRGDLKGFSAYFPLVGWFLGASLLVLNNFLFIFPAFGRGFLVVLFWEFASRFLHLDALADAADAFLRGGKKEELMEIMSDSKVGAFGVSAIVFLLIGKFALVSSFNAKTSSLALLAAVLFSRYLLTLICYIFPAAKNEGLGWLVCSNTGFKELAIATFTLLPAIFVFQLRVLLVLGGLVFPFLIAFIMVKKAGGVTGDILGTSLEISEIFILLFFLVPLRL